MAKLRINSNKARTRKRKVKSRVQTYRYQVKKLHSRSWYYNQNPDRRKELDEKLNTFLSIFRASSDYREIQKALVNFIDILNLFEKEDSFDINEFMNDIYGNTGDLSLNVAEFDKKTCFAG